MSKLKTSLFTAMLMATLCATTFSYASNPTFNRELIIISPHHDDAILTFGGFIESEKAAAFLMIPELK